MNNYGIFALDTISEESLYAIVYEDASDEYENNEFEKEPTKKNEFERLFNNWSDPEYLEAFFEKHKSDLQKEFYNFISIEDAIKQTLSEASDLEKKLIEIAENGKTNNQENLQTLFKPLNKTDEIKRPIPDYQESKAYGTNQTSWLRIYAIRLDKNLFIISGGGIKLTENMNTREHLLNELDKLKKTKQFLIDSGIADTDSLMEFIEL